MPTLPSGKVDRPAAPRAPGPGADRRAGPAGVGRRTDLEREIARVWGVVFAPLPVSLDDDFFRDLGGHSLLAARLVSELRCNHDLPDLSVLDVYTHPTIEAARRAGSRPTGARGPTPRPGRRRPPRRRDPVPRRVEPPSPACGLAQFFALYFVVGFYSLQWLTPYLAYTWMIEGGATIPESLFASLSSLLAVYPVMLAVSIAVKWLVVGKFRAGEYPLWGAEYFKVWFVRAIEACVPVSYMAGTPLLAWYYRLMGATVGANVHIGSDTLRAFDLISIGDDSCVGSDTEIAGYAFKDGLLTIGPVTIGRGCFVGNRVVIGEGAVMEDGAKLEDLSLLPGGATVPRGERWAGSPGAAGREGSGRRPVEGGFRAAGPGRSGSPTGSRN